MITGLVILGLLVGLVMWFVGIYNSLVQLRNRVKNAWSQIDVQLKRRHDLIPNLVETVKGYMTHERETLESVTQARAAAVGAGTVGEKSAAEGKLILLVGAARDDLARAKPILETLASSILHFGAVGTGTAFKLMNNLLGAVHIASLAEAVSLANKLGLDRETLIAAIESGPCASPHVTRLARPMVEGEISPTPALSIGLREKDARYCLGLARDAEMSMSVGEIAHRWYQLATGSLAQVDDSALIQTVAAYAGSVPESD